MTDKQIEVLYKSIPDVENFKNRIKKEDHINLSGDLEITIEGTVVEISLKANLIRLDRTEFTQILNELCEQQEFDQENEIRKEKKKSAEARKHELTLISNNVYRVEKEYLDEMFYARQVSVGFNSYKIQLKKIVRVLNDSGTILIEDKRISNNLELEKELKWRIGLESLKQDLESS